MHMRTLLLSVLVTLPLTACGGEGAAGADAGPGDSGSGGSDSGTVRTDSGTPSLDAGGSAHDGGSVLQDAGAVDAASPVDAAVPAIHYNCGAFTEAPSWTLAPGYHAVVVADSTDGLNQPVALVVAGGAYGGQIIAVNQGNNTLTTTDPLTGATRVVVSTTGWSVAPYLLTSIVWDAESVFDGALYVADQGNDRDMDSRIMRVRPDFSVSTLINTEGAAGLDDVYAMVFAPRASAYRTGLYVTGDTDGAAVDWGIVSSAGVSEGFSDVGGCEGAAFDLAGTYGGGLFAACPSGGGYAGNDAVNRVSTIGLAGTPLASSLPGVHAPAFAPAGPFGGKLHVASWSSQKLSAIATDGTVTDLATGLSLTNYDGNILAFSPDGLVLFVADRTASRIVCIEPTTR